MAHASYARTLIERSRLFNNHIILSLHQDSAKKSVVEDCFHNITTAGAPMILSRNPCDEKATQIIKERRLVKRMRAQTPEREREREREGDNYLLTAIHNTEISKTKGNYFPKQKIAGISTSVHDIQLRT